MLNLDAVIVTFNRLKKLKHALECYDKQTVPFRTLIVVDNHSTDGTIEFLRDWETQNADYKKVVIYLPNNVGGSGGFYEGEKYAVEHDADWAYISDDDAYPEERLVEKFQLFYDQHSNEKMSAVCAAVTYINGEIIDWTRGHIAIKNNRFLETPATKDEYSSPYFEFNAISYVGAFISINAMKQVGLVNPDFFIYQDDIEHSIRLSKYAPMYCVPDLKVAHDTDILTQMTDEDKKRILWKEYYLARNYIYMIIHHYPAIKNAEILHKLDSIRSHRDSSMTIAEKMRLEGVWDAIHGRLGIHKIYHPGMDVNTEDAPYPAIIWQIVYWLLRIRRKFVKNQD